jgi:predicted pyridoxine 5'-phosphate oxidase superfamily flavin-nucleotide-binding protein
MLDDLNSNKASTHEAERKAHKRFGVEDIWNAYNFNDMFRASIPKGMAAFVESLPFFFIATANARGECDCSFRGRESDASGRPYALVKVLDAKTLIFPDYSGNNFFNSLGNILVNGQIGMLFIDFESRRRIRINGRASIVEDRHAYAELWPLAQRYIQVTVEQAFGNCRSRIPRMKLIAPTDSEFQDE